MSNNNKYLKIRINSVKSTQKITKAMKMVAASKLKKFRTKSDLARSYHDNLIFAAKKTLATSDEAVSCRNIFEKQEEIKNHLFIITSSNRGLCGAFNSNIFKEAKQKIADVKKLGIKPLLFVIGKKSFEYIKNIYPELIIDNLIITDKKGFSFSCAKKTAKKIIDLFQQGSIDSCSIIYSKFKSAAVQQTNMHDLIPFNMDLNDKHQDDAIYDFSLSPAFILENLILFILTAKIYLTLSENEASEQAARMSAMENASQNAGEMIEKLILKYNSSRQASVTKELMEIISGAEAV